MSARTPKYSCAPPRASRKPTNTSSKISTIPRSAAHGAQFLEPRGVGRAVEVGAAPAVDQGRVARARSTFGCSACSGLTSTQAMSRRGLEHPERGVVHVLQRVGLARRERIADAGLHVAPPAVVRAAEAHQVAAARVVARQPHGLHHRLGSRHVKGHLVQPGDLEQAAHVVGGHRMIGAEHRPEVAHPLAAARDALLVEVVAEHVHAVRAGQIVEAVAVEIGDRDAGRGLLRTRRP